MFAVSLATGAVLAQPPSPVWTPPLQTSWQWQLTGTLDLSVDAQMYDVDLFQTDAAAVAELHRRGRRAVCYVSVGTFEPWRPDAPRFPDSIKGRALEDFADERWLDIRRWDVLGPILEARFDQCKSKGFDGIEPDNVDGYTNRTGFPLTYQDQLAFNRRLADAAHARGLSIGLKNDLDQIRDLLPHFDWALNEQCFQYRECGELSRFVAAGKAVFNVEYRLQPDQFCAQANQLNFNSLRKNIDLDAARVACRAAAPPEASFLNAASYAGGAVSPGELMVVFGNALNPGLRVWFDELPATVLGAYETQAALVAPLEIRGRRTVQVVLDRAGVRSPAIPLDVAVARPAIFSMDASGRGQGAIVNQTGNLNAVEPAARGAIVSIYATGHGVGLPVTVRIGGRTAEVLYADVPPGGTPGLLQVNARVPTETVVGDAIPVELAAGSVTSPPGVTMRVAP